MIQKPVYQFIAVAVFIVLLLSSCSRIKTAATDLISSPTAKERYQRQYQDSPQLLEIWEAEAKEALLDSATIRLPYSEAGQFLPRTFAAYSYEIALNPGENLQVKVHTDSLGPLVFIDLYKLKIDSARTFEHLRSANFESTDLKEEISEPGIYKVVIQPEIEANSPFRLHIFKEPTYLFPVASAGNSAVQSFWGASRDAGRRSHEGIDIFAPRGTPVVAATYGRISSTGNKGLGGKQVWLRDQKRNQSLYYAHLDSIIARPGMAVKPGDTLGLVGNTGNARTTPPHLHFGIYRGRKGAVNPLGYVFESEEPEPIDFVPIDFHDNRGITTSAANLRTGPSTSYAVINTLKPRDTLHILGKTNRWYHVSTEFGNSFIHESLVTSP